MAQKYLTTFPLARGLQHFFVKKLKTSAQKGKNQPQLSHYFAPTLQGNNHLYIFVIERY
jgi:hypothetical protein